MGLLTPSQSGMQARGAQRRGFVPSTGVGRLTTLTQDNLTSLTAVQGVLSAAGRYTVPEPAEVFLDSGSPMRFFLMGTESFTFTTAAIPATRNLTLSSPPIRTTRTAPTLPTNDHPDIMVVVTSSGSGVAVGTALPVTVFADGSTTVTIDTSSLTGSTSVTVEAYYLPVGQSAELQVAAPMGSTTVAMTLLNGGTRDLFARDPLQAGSQLTVPFVNGFPRIMLPQYFQVNVLANYTNTVPTLSYSDISIPARTFAGAYTGAQGEGAMLESSIARARLGLSG